MYKGIILGLVALAILVILNLVQSKFINRKEQQLMQKKMRERQNEIKELMKEGSEESKKKAQKIQAEMLEESSKMMSKTLKYFIVVSIIIIPLFALINKFYGNVVLINTELGRFIPLLGAITWFWWYILVALIAGSLVTNMGALWSERYDKSKSEKA